MGRAEVGLGLALLCLVAAPSAHAKPSKGVLHRVAQPSETYASIAEHYYGHRYLGHHLRVVNRQPEPLSKGRTLIIPTSREVALAPGQSLESFAKTNLGKATRAAYLESLHFLKSKKPRAGKRLRVPTSLRHVVRPGESLGSIARNYYRDAGRRRLALLRQYNGLSSNTLRVGDVVRIPLDTEAFAHEAVIRRSKREFGASEAAPEVATAPPPTRAGAKPRSVGLPQARRDVERAEGLYGEGRYAQCLRYAKQVLQKHDTGLPKGPKVELLRLAGASLVALDRVAEAEATFVQLRRIDAGYELDLYQTSPKILDVFESARP